MKKLKNVEIGDNFIAGQPLRIARLNAATSNFDEVIDTLVDVFGIGLTLEKELGDGFQWADAFALFKTQPLINEVINDFDVFLQQFIQLDGTRAIAAVEQARKQLLSQGYTFGKASNVILNGLYLVARTFSRAERTYDDAKDTLADFYRLRDGLSLFPE